MRGHSVSALVGCVAALALSTSPASAAPSVPAQNSSALLRGAHLSPDTPAVDVYLTDTVSHITTLALPHVRYGDVGDYQRIKPGLYTVGIRPAGAETSTPVVISWTLDAKPGSASTALAIGMRKSLQGRVLSDDLTPLPAGQARVRVIQASERAKTVDVTADRGRRLAVKLPFSVTTDYTTVPAGSWPVTTRSLDNRGISTTTNAIVKAGGADTVIVLDGDHWGSISARVIDDAIGADLPPIGPPTTSSGDTAMPHFVDVGAEARRVALWGFSGVMTLAVAVVLFGFRRTDQRW